MKLEASNLSLLQSRGPKFGEKVYLCASGVRRYVPSIDRLRNYGVNWPNDLVQVPDAVLSSLAIGGWLPHTFEEQTEVSNIRSSAVMREFMARELSGIGLEVGAGASPFPIPLGCKVYFGDHITLEQLVDELYPGQSSYDLVSPDLMTDFDKFDGVADESLDFIIGCHVIEHVLDPIGTIINSYKKLKPGGQLLLVIPDKHRTFDRERPLTTLEHLIEDHFMPDDHRDRLHYEEFFKLALPVPEADLQDRVAEAILRKADCHFHVWDYERFNELINYVSQKFFQWSEIWSHPTLSDEREDIEFYFRLRK